MSTPLPPEGTERSLRGVPPSKTPEARRVRRFTTDPRYGPKLNQLPKGEQRRLLDLVTVNRGRQARQETLTAYQTRREARNARARELRRTNAESKAWSNLYSQLPEGRRSLQQKYLGHMEYRHLHFAQKATSDELRNRARAQTAEEAPNDFVTIDGVEVNVFWYR